MERPLSDEAICRLDENTLARDKRNKRISPERLLLEQIKYERWVGMKAYEALADLQHTFCITRCKRGKAKTHAKECIQAQDALIGYASS